MFASGPTRHSIRRSKSVGTTVAGKVRKRQRNGKALSKSRLSDEDVSDTGSEQLEVFKPISNKTNISSVTNSFDNGAFNRFGEKKVEIGTEEKEHGRTREDKNTEIINTTHDTTTISVPVIETNFTDAENEEKDKISRVSNGHIPPILKAPDNSENHKLFKKICSPPVLRKISGNGVIPDTNSLPLEDVELLSFSEGRNKKYSNNHLYVPNDVC